MNTKNMSAEARIQRERQIVTEWRNGVPPTKIQAKHNISSATLTNYGKKHPDIIKPSNGHQKPNGKARSPYHGRGLPEAVADRALAALKNGMLPREVAAQVGCHISTIYALKDRPKRKAKRSTALVPIEVNGNRAVKVIEAEVVPARSSTRTAIWLRKWNQAFFEDARNGRINRIAERDRYASAAFDSCDPPE